MTGKIWTPSLVEHLLLVGEPLSEFIRDKENAPPYNSGFAGDVWTNTAIYTKKALTAFKDRQTKVSVFGMIGSDKESDDLLEFMQSNGVNTDLVTRHPSKKLGSVTNDLVAQARGDEAGSRILDRAESASRETFVGMNKLSMEKLLQGKTCLYVSGTILGASRDRSKVIELMKMAREKGIKVIFSTNLRPQLWAFKSLDEAGDFKDVYAKAAFYMNQALQHADIVFASHDDEKRMFPICTTPEVSAKRIHGYSPAKEVIVTDGANPITLHTYDYEGKLATADTIMTPKVKNVVDITGAGDSFAGTYLASRFNGESPQRSAEMAAIIGSHVVQFAKALPSHDSQIPYARIIVPSQDQDKPAALG